MSRQPHAKGRNVAVVRGATKDGKSITVKMGGLGALVLAPSLEGKDEEGTVIVKRKARYHRPAFA